MAVSWIKKMASPWPKMTKKINILCSSSVLCHAAQGWPLFTLFKWFLSLFLFYLVILTWCWLFIKIKNNNTRNFRYVSLEFESGDAKNHSHIHKTLDSHDWYCNSLLANTGKDQICHSGLSLFSHRRSVNMSQNSVWVGSTIITPLIIQVLRAYVKLALFHFSFSHMWWLFNIDEGHLFFSWR